MKQSAHLLLRRSNNPIKYKTIGRYLNVNGTSEPKLEVQNTVRHEGSLNPGLQNLNAEDFRRSVMPTGDFQSDVCFLVYYLVM